MAEHRLAWKCYQESLEFFCGLIWEKGKSRIILKIALLILHCLTPKIQALGIKHICQCVPLLPAWRFHGPAQGKEGLCSARVTISISGVGSGAPALCQEGKSKRPRSQ